MSLYKYLKIQEVIEDLNTLSYKIMRLPRWISGKKKKKKSPCQAGDVGLILGLGRSPGEGNGNPFQRGHKASNMTEQLSIAQHIIRKT